MNSVDKIQECFVKNKNLLKDIEEYKQFHWNDEELFILWSYFMERIPLNIGCQVSPYLSVFELTKEEYCWCMCQIFGENSGVNSFKYMKKDSSWDKEKSARRMANDIVMTYRRRGLDFLRGALKKNKQTNYENLYLNENNYGFLNEKGNLYAEKLLKVRKDLT